MRVRLGILAVALAVSLAACSGDPESDPQSGPQSDSPSSSPAAPLTEITISCAEFAETAKRITDAQAALYAGPGGAAVIDDLVDELDALKEGAPADVQAALTDMGEAFRDALEILDNPTAESRARLAELGPQLSEAGQKITAYFTSQCE